jgi:hypothetical protein
MQGSKPNYCINMNVLRKGNINEECDELLKDGIGGCRYHKNAKTLTHGDVKV